MMKRILAILVLGVVLGLGLIPGTTEAAACPSEESACGKAVSTACDCGATSATAGQFCCAVKSIVKLSNEQQVCKDLCAAGVTPGAGIPTGLCAGRTMGHEITGCEGCPKGRSCAVEACCLLDLVYTVTDWIFVILLVISGIVIIWGGIEFVTSGGAPEKITSARQKLIWALVGVIVAFAARGLVLLITQII